MSKKTKTATPLPPSTAPNAFIPDGVDVSSYDIWLVNTSAGKDSQVALDVVVALADKIGFPRSKIVAVHCDLGRVEWQGTRELAERQVATYGIRFEVVRRPQGDLLTHIEAHGKFPSNSCRFCTSDHKRGQVETLMTKLVREHNAKLPIKVKGQPKIPCRILNIMGIRAEESSARSKQQPFQPNARGTSGTRTVDRWYPIFSWRVTEIWDRIRSNGLEAHKAYSLGMKRLSCCFCIYAPKPALLIAGYHNRELLSQYVKVEEKINHVFRQDCTLKSIQDELDSGIDIAKVVDSDADDGCWNMG